MLSAPVFTGLGTAIVTPFCADGIDFTAFRKLIDRQIAGGASALAVCGTTGEPPTLTEDEWERVIACAVEQSGGRIRIIAGTGSNNTAHAIFLGKRAKALGADAQLSVTPYYNKTTQRGLIAHFTAIMEESAFPAILYNVPSRTALDMLPDTVAALCDHPMLAGVKEASGLPERAAEIKRLCGSTFPVYSGTDEVNAEIMALGAEGIISVVSNLIPAYFKEMLGVCMQDPSAAQRMQQKIQPLTRVLFCETSPVPVKQALCLMGLCEARVRLPLVPMESRHIEDLKKEMTEMGLLPV